MFINSSRLIQSIFFDYFFRLSVTREFSEELTSISDTVFKYLSSVYREDSGVVLYPFNSAVVVEYDAPLDNTLEIGRFKFNGSRNVQFRFHTDMTFSDDGTFLSLKNSQVEKSLVAILTVGCTRELEIISKSKNGDIQCSEIWNRVFHLEHGSLLVIDPRDEEPEIRPCISPAARSFYQHGNVKFGRPNEMSLAIVFRVSRHLRRFSVLTGKYILSEPNEMKKKYEKNKKKVEEFLYDHKNEKFRQWYHHRKLILYKNCIESRFGNG